MSLRSPVIRLSGRRLLLPALLLAALATPVQAEVLTLRDALAAALSRNPELRGFEFRFKVADAVRDQATLRPAPELSISLDNFAGSGELAGLREAETTLSLSQLIEIGGKRDARIALADASHAAIDTERQAAQLDVMAELTGRFIDVAELQELVAVARRGTELADRTVRSTDRRVKAAKAPHVEIDRASLDLGQAQIEQRALENRLDAALQALSAMWGRSDATLDGRPVTAVAGDIFQLPEKIDFPTLAARLEASPDALRYAGQMRLREAELKLATAQQRSDWTLGGGVRRLQGTGDSAFVASLSVPLFSSRRAQGDIAAARAERDLVNAGREAAMVNARAQLYALHRDLETAIDTVATLESTAMPRIDEALKETQYAFERGRYGYLELIDSQREYLAVLRARIEAGAAAQRLAAQIERLTRAGLASSSDHREQLP